MREVELKFDLAPKDHGALRRHPALAEAPSRTTRLLATYFDTPGFELREREMALRLRRSGRRWVQTLKAGRSGAAGLHARDEWETDRPGPTLDLDALAGTALADAAGLADRLAELFTVDMRRTTWQVEVAPGDRVEVALDRGHVGHGDRREAISEVEIESVSGDPHAVFEMASRLLGDDGTPGLALLPSSVTKAQRGYRLARPGIEGPARALAAPIEGNMSPAQAARATGEAALAQMLANQPGVLAGEDPEYLHQFRVGLRRLRSALGVYRAVLEPEAATFRQELRWIAGLAGPARDWDVFATSTLPTLLEAHGDARVSRSLRARAAARRRIAHAALGEALRSMRWARLQLALARWLAQDPPEPQGEALPLPGFAVRVVRRRHKRLLRDAQRLSALTPAERHALRLDAKRLRYALEALAPLFRRKRVTAHLRALSEIQDDLGRANDAAVAARLLAELSAPSGLAQFARGWFAAEAHAGAAGLERHAEALASVKRLALRSAAGD